MYRSENNPEPTTELDIRYAMRVADDVISTEVMNFKAIGKLAIIGLEQASKPEPVDMLAVWEYYVLSPEELKKLPDEDDLSRRQYVCDRLTAFCDKWWEYAHSFLSYDDSYSWEFVPIFLGNLPTHDVDELTFEQIMAALTSVDDYNTFKQFERTKAQA